MLSQTMGWRTRVQRPAICPAKECGGACCPLGDDRIAEAGRVAAVTAASLAEGFAAAHLQRIDRDAAVATAWLNRRTLELCGAVVPWIGDLFDAEPPVGHWRSNPAAEQRLAGFAIDPSVPVSHRRDAEGTLSRFRAIMSAQPVWSSPVTRTLGMLMLCP